MPNKPELNRDLLFELLACHATPGDEGEVRLCLEREWQQAGWATQRLGDLAILATEPNSNQVSLPTLLVCAHMDSPGYAIESRQQVEDNRWRLVTLGGAKFCGETAAGSLKGQKGTVPVTLYQTLTEPPNDDDEPRFTCKLSPSCNLQPAQHVHHGDRVCFASNPVITDDTIVAPFLDNRLGCWLVAELTRLAATWASSYQIVVAATAGEEFSGHGAAVLAHHLSPDLTIVIDATYTNADQKVELGGGPVLTLSDRSVLISPARRDALRALFNSAHLPLQTEVYNFSGTDAQAFPLQGVFTPVLPLLIPTTGNHTPAETADLRDADALIKGIKLLAETKPGTVQATG